VSAERAVYNSGALPLGSEREGILFIATPQTAKEMLCVLRSGLIP
jgi:hypothetical protein